MLHPINALPLVPSDHQVLFLLTQQRVTDFAAGSLVILANHPDDKRDVTKILNKLACLHRMEEK
jgi:anaerobic glycerol-3-phosphate dehydrogenase